MGGIRRPAAGKTHRPWLSSGPISAPCDARTGTCGEHRPGRSPASHRPCRSSVDIIDLDKGRLPFQRGQDGCPAMDIAHRLAAPADGVPPPGPPSAKKGVKRRRWSRSRTTIDTWTSGTRLICGLNPSRASRTLSVSVSFSQIGPGRPWDGPFYAKNAEFCVKCPFGRLWWTFKIGLPAL